MISLYVAGCNCLYVRAVGGQGDAAPCRRQPGRRRRGHGRLPRPRATCGKATILYYSGLYCTVLYYTMLVVWLSYAVVADFQFGLARSSTISSECHRNFDRIPPEHRIGAP